MDTTDPVKHALRKGVIIGLVTAIAVLGIAIGLPLWWFSSGRDMQTLHDGLSVQFRNSVAEILTLDGYIAKKAAYESSVPVTHRDNVLKYGEQTPGQYKAGELLNYIRWQRELEFKKELFDKLMELGKDPRIRYPSNHHILTETKANADRAIEDIKTANAEMEACRDAVITMLRDRTVTIDSRCTPVPDKDGTQ